MLEPAPRSQVTLGGTTVTYLPDGHARLEPTVLFPKSGPTGWAAYAAYLDRDGRLPVSVGSFLVRTSEHRILIDLGLGRVAFDVPGVASFASGRLLDSLRAENLTPEDIDTVVFTHLHHDHVGWTTNVAPAPNAEAGQVVTGLTFADARHLVDEGEWNHWHGTADSTGPDPVAVQHPLADVIEFLDDSRQIAPGVVALPTPGHTPGHTSVLVTDPTSSRRLLILGDVMHSQAQVGEIDWNFLFDDDAERGTRTRAALVEDYQDEDTIVAGGHFAGAVFGRFLPARRRHGWAVATGADSAGAGYRVIT